MVIQLMSLLGAGMVTLASGATRGSWWISATTPTWTLSTSAHLPLPLSKRDIILIGAFCTCLPARPI
jgi:hypothetical protein